MVAEDIPVETYTRRNCQWSIRELIGRILRLNASIVLPLHGSESLVIVVLQLWVDRQLETQTSSQAETVREVNLILNVSRELVVLHGSQELARTVHWEGNAIASRSLAVHEVVHRLEYIVTGRSSTEAVGSLVGLKLETSGEVLDAHRPCSLISSNESLHLTEVTLSKWIRTESHIVRTILQDIHCWEHTTHISTWLILIRVSSTENIVYTTPLRVPLSSERSKVLLLIVACTLEVETSVSCTTRLRLTTRSILTTRIDDRILEWSCRA